MKLKKFLLFITYFIIVYNSEQLFSADGTGTNPANLINLNTDLNLIDDNIIELADNICNYILQGHSTDEVIKMLNDDQKHSYNINIEKLVIHIERLLNKKYSIDNIINILAGNKECEKFYIQKNFWAKIKNTYFVVKSTAMLVLIVVVFYLLYLLAKWLKFKIPWFKHKDQRFDDKISESSNIKLYNHGKSPQMPTDQEAQSRYLDIQQTHPASGHMPTQTTQGIPKSSQNEQSFDGSRFPNCEDEIGDIDKLDLELSHSVIKQTEQAKRIGLETEVVQVNVIEKDREQRRNIPVGEIGKRFLQQIEYAKSIGLIPQ